MNKLLKSIAIPLVCLLTGSFLSPSAKAIDTDKLSESSVRIFKINSEEPSPSGHGSTIWFGTGTGFIVNENGNVVTNQHVVNGAEVRNGVTQLFVLRYNKGATRLYRVKCDAPQQSKELDLAVLTTTVKAPYLVMNSVEPRPTAVAYTMGYPAISDAKDSAVKSAWLDLVLAHRDDPGVDDDGVDVTRDMAENPRLQDMVKPSFSTGQTKRIANQAFSLVEGSKPVRVIDCDISTAHGNSGGPFLDEAGFVIGVVGEGVSSAEDFTVSSDSNGQATKVTRGIDKVDFVIAEMELERFLQDRKIGFHKISFDVRKLGHMTTRQKVLISLACLCALIAAGLAFLLYPRRQPVTPSTTVLIEKLEKRLAGRVGGVPFDGGAKPSRVPESNAIWEFDIEGPGGFRQSVRLTDTDFKRGRGRVVLGRNSDFSDVMVKHDSVSRQHLHFELRDTGIVVADRHSSNGTKVNGRSLGKPFQSQSLREGDRLQFGELTASVRRGF